ncbi:MAG: ABC transporter permease [Clostridiales bacterium]|jgi:spermidine/putrescine transport system permease protein|nr:ABC transporter permease [Clostridiales bacterium]
MKFLSRLYTFLVFGFLYAPIAVMVVYSFNSEKSRTNFGTFSLRWYIELFSDSVILKSLYISLVVAVLSALIATVIGTFAAVGIDGMKGAMKKAYLTVNNIPVVNPDIVTAISMMVLFVFFITRINGLNMGFGTLLIAHITFNIPYVILSVLPKLRGMDSNIYHAALDLGCPPTKSFIKVVIPEILPGIITGFIMAFTLSLDDFVISYFNSGSTAQTLPVTIYSMTKRPYSPKINALSTLLFISVMLLLVVVNARQSAGEKRGSDKRKGVR